MVDIGVDNGGIDVRRRVNIESLDDVVDVQRGLDASRSELNVMLSCANRDQKSIYQQLIKEMKVNSAAFVSGAAGTGKSYILRMLERYYTIQGYKVKMVNRGLKS